MVISLFSYNVVQIPQVCTSKYGNSFKYAAAVLWNSFPDDLISSDN